MLKEMFVWLLFIIAVIVVIYVLYTLIVMVYSAQSKFSHAMLTSNPDKNIKEIWIWSPLLTYFGLVFGTILAKIPYDNPYFVTIWILFSLFAAIGVLVLPVIVLIKLNNQYKYFLAENNLYQNQDIKKYKNYLGWFYYISMFFNLISFGISQLVFMIIYSVHLRKVTKSLIQWHDNNIKFEPLD